MGILDEDVAAVRAASDIVGVISQYLQLRRVGRRWTGLCPFHPEKSPSFSVNAEEGLYYCLAGETRVLTWEGVKPIGELAGTTVRVLTEEGRWVDAPFSSFGVQPLMRITLGRNGRSKVVHATAEHRWYVRSGRDNRFERTTAQLRSGHQLAWSFTPALLPAIGELSPFGVAHGLVFGTGGLTGDHATLELRGDRDAQLLKWFPLNRTVAGTSTTGEPYTKVLDLPRSYVGRPPLDESPEYLAGWLAGYLAAVGEVAADGTCSFASVHRSDLELVRTLCTRLGIGTYGITVEPPSAPREGAAGDEGIERHRLDLIADDVDERLVLLDDHRTRLTGAPKGWARRGWVVQAVEATDRVEEVFCAQVEGTHNFTLEDNVLTGNCFGCQARGDVITFVREVEHQDFVGAVEWLAAKAGVSLHYTDRNEGEGRKRRTKLVEVMTRAVDWYHERLLSSADAGGARRYLRERGLDGDVVREYRIGWAPDSWDELCRALRLNEDDARDTGLGFRNSRNRLQDTFRARVLFPISDPQGDPVSFGGRILPGHDDPRNNGKYKNTPETPLYHKSKVLYGLDRSKAAIVSADTAIVCEGYTDVIGFARSGVPLAVATCGTALTDEHVKLLRRYARRLVLAFDADGAGQAAAERFYQWERDHDLEVAVADLPEGRDPADVAQSEPERLAEAVSGATPFLRFRLDRAFAAADLATPEGRAKAAERALVIVAEHPVDLVRDQYLMEVASRCRLEPERLRPTLDRFIANPPPPPAKQSGARSGDRRGPGANANRRPDGAGGPGDSRGPGRGGPGDGRSSSGPGRGGSGDGRRGPGGSSGPSDGPPGWDGPMGGADEGWGYDDGSAPPHPADMGSSSRGSARPSGSGSPAAQPQGRRDAAGSDRPALEVLRHAVHNRGDVDPWLHELLFRDPTHQAVVAALRGAPSIAAAIDAADPSVADLLSRLVVDEPDSEPFDAVRRLGTEVARAEVTVLRLGAASHVNPGEVLAESAFLGHCIDELRMPDTSVTALERLLAWLSQRVGDGG